MGDLDTLFKPEEIAGVYQSILGRAPTGEELKQFLERPLEEIVEELLTESAEKAELDRDFYSQFSEYAELDKCDADFKIGEALEQIFIRTFGKKPTGEQVIGATIEAQQLGGGIGGVSAVVASWIEHLFKLAVGEVLPTFPGEEESAFIFKNKAIVGFNLGRAFPEEIPEEFQQLAQSVDNTTESVEELLSQLSVVPVIPFEDEFYLKNLYYLNHPEEKPTSPLYTTSSTTAPSTGGDQRDGDGVPVEGNGESGEEGAGSGGSGIGTCDHLELIYLETENGPIPYYICTSAPDVAPPPPPEGAEISATDLLHWTDGS
ncbi:MAG: hypothetical protein ABGW77_00595 [Campylobacterales bacterium]